MPGIETIVFADTSLPKFTPNVKLIFNKCIDGIYSVFPGFCDVHVHFREPGFSYKETIKSGTEAGAHGGYTDVCTMPNLNPVPDTAEHLKIQKDIIDTDACIHVHPYGSITAGLRGQKLSEMNEIADSVVAFSDDGKGVQNDDIMEQAMITANSLHKIIAAHCEIDELKKNGVIHDGPFAKKAHFAGIPSECEYLQIKRDIELAKRTGCAYHVCHVSCKESVNLIREAKKAGIDITCETAPHYLVFDDNDLCDDGAFKMNPPIREHEDRIALIEGIIDGTIDMIATDHAPHSYKEKSGGLNDSLFGISGLETAFQILYNKLVKSYIIDEKMLIKLMAINPRKRFGIPTDSGDYSVWDLNRDIIINSTGFLSCGHCSPFIGMTGSGVCVMTVCNNKVVYQNPEYIK